MRDRYNKQLRDAKDTVLHMGQLCMEALTVATQTLLTGEVRLANRAVLCTEEAEKQGAQVYALCETVILQQQPVAYDLRQVMAAQRIAADLRRITGQGAGIAEIIRKADMRRKDNADNSILPIDDCRAVARMADAVIKMVQDALTSYEVHDRDKAFSVRNADSEVDSLFRDARAELVGMMTRGGATQGAAECALDFMLIAKYLERAGDHTVAVANAVLFLLGASS